MVHKRRLFETRRIMTKKPRNSRYFDDPTPTGKEFSDYGGVNTPIFKTRDLVKVLSPKRQYDIDWTKKFRLKKSPLRNRVREAQRFAEAFYSELMDYIIGDIIEKGNTFCFADKHTRIEPFMITGRDYRVGVLGFTFDLDGIDEAIKRQRKNNKEHKPIVKVCKKRDWYELQRNAKRGKYIEMPSEEDLETMLKKERIKQLRSENNV
jgi:hypothetical protein